MNVGEILEQMFELEHNFAVPDILFDQELNHQPHYLDLGLGKLELTAESVADVMRIKQELAPSAISTNDLFALSLAKQENCRLLTGDRALRRLSESEGVQVHGTIWVIEQMLSTKLITCEQAERAYQLMRADGSRLPWEETEAQIIRYKTK